MTVYSRLASPRETRAVLEDFGLATKHRMGQNFLVSDAVVGRILELAELGPEDVVLEVGPGIGTLTVALLARARAVCSIEADLDLECVLDETCGFASEKFALIMGDALRARPEDVSRSLAEVGVDELPGKLVSNLPYQVAATTVLRVLEEWPSVGREVVMVQAEVADRICAAPGNKTYGAYTAKLALLGEVTGRFEVGPQNFMPAPHVDSAVLRIERRPLPDPATGEPLSPEAVREAAQVIDSAFAQRRKTIRNSMASSGYDKGALDAAFSATGIAGTSRAETLAPEDFVRLASALA